MLGCAEIKPDDYIKFMDIDNSYIAGSDWRGSQVGISGNAVQLSDIIVTLRDDGCYSVSVSLQELS